MRKSVRVGFVVAAGLLLGLASSPARAEGSGLSLEVAASKEVYQQGEAVRLNLTLTNKSGRACQLSEVPDGTLNVTGVDKDGSAVRPSLSVVTYEDGLAANVLGHLQPTEPGAKAQFVVAGGAVAGQNGDRQGLPTVAYSPAGRNIRSVYPVDTPGEYTASLSYAMPNLPGVPQDVCRGVSNTVGIHLGVALLE